MRLLCENPIIEYSAANQKIINSLQRVGLAKHDLSSDLYIVDWDAVLKTREIRLIGKKSIVLIREWAKSAQQSRALDAASPDTAVALCPHCGKPIQLVAPASPRQ